MRLLHPLIPFVTEALWTALTSRESVVVAPWPRADQSRVDPGVEAEIAALQAVVSEVRRFRADQGVKPAQRIPALVHGMAAGAVIGARSLLRLDEPGERLQPHRVADDLDRGAG